MSNEEFKLRASMGIMPRMPFTQSLHSTSNPQPSSNLSNLKGFQYEQERTLSKTISSYQDITAKPNDRYSGR